MWHRKKEERSSFFFSSFIIIGGGRKKRVRGKRSGQEQSTVQSTAQWYLVTPRTTTAIQVVGTLAVLLRVVGSTYGLDVIPLRTAVHQNIPICTKPLFPYSTVPYIAHITVYYCTAPTVHNPFRCESSTFLNTNVFTPWTAIILAWTKELKTDRWMDRNSTGRYSIQHAYM
jgi:hypothetical protein